MIHTNIRSVAKNMNKLDMYLNNLKHEFPIMPLSETWLNENTCDRHDMDGYNAEHNFRSNRGDGGVSLYIKDFMVYTIWDELCFQNKTLETVLIELNKDQFKKKQNIVVGVIYRPPDTDIKEFNDYIVQCLTQTKAEKKIAYLLGDYNINLLNVDKHAPSQDFADAMFSHSFFPVITKPTRVTDQSVTLIDNIFCNNYVDNSSSLAGILYTDISDHFPVYHIDYSDDVPMVDNSFKNVYTLWQIWSVSLQQWVERIGILCCITTMHRMLILHSIMNSSMYTIIVFLLRSLSEAIEPANHGHPMGWRLQ